VIHSFGSTEEDVQSRRAGAELLLDPLALKPKMSKKDPDIPQQETKDILQDFPFVQALDFKRPIETRLRATVRTKLDFENS